jgi:Tfp pilus assembly protein PilW
MPFLRAEAGVGLRVMNSTASSDVGFFSDAGGFTAREFASTFTANAATGATPSVAGIGTLLINNGSAQNITALNSGSDGQIVQLVFQNANTTMVSSATLLLAGSVNVTPTAWSVITMLKVPTSTSDRWIELSRSIK